MAAVGKQEARTDGRSIPFRSRVGRDLEGSKLGQEGLDAWFASVPVQHESQQHQENEEQS